MPHRHNNRLQPVRIQLGTTGTPNANSCLVYNYYSGSNPTSCALPSSGSSNNGKVMGYFDQDTTTPSFNHTASYNYDPLNRLSAASATGSSTYSLQFLYDRWGNMTCNTHANPNGLCANVVFNTNNQVASIGVNNPVHPTYDAAGNLTYDGTNSYTWDAEGRQLTVGGARSYVYNALGQQVEWSNLSFDFLYDKDGRWVYFVNEIDGSQTYSEIPFLGGRYLASYRSDGTHLTHANLLGSTTMETTAACGVMEDQLFYPWGQFWRQTAATGWSFASMPYRDQPLGHDVTPNRIYDYNTAPGRWLSPDPLAGDVTNPQSLNRYAYALNNPTTLIDPLGLDPCPPGTPPGVYCVNVIGTTNSSYDGSWQFQIESALNFLNALNQQIASYANGGNPGGGNAAGGSASGRFDVDRPFTKTFPCNKSPAQLVDAVKQNFSSLASYQNDGTYAIFAPEPISQGEVIPITTTLDLPVIPRAFTSENDAVVVSSARQTGWTFTAVAGQHPFNPGTVDFNAASAGPGQVTFSVHVSGNFASRRYSLGFNSGGAQIEANIWNGFLNKVAGVCGSN